MERMTKEYLLEVLKEKPIFISIEMATEIFKPKRTEEKRLTMEETILMRLLHPNVENDCFPSYSNNSIESLLADFCLKNNCIYAPSPEYGFNIALRKPTKYL